MATKDLLITILGLLGLAWLLQPKEIRPGQEQAHSMTPQVVPAQSHVQVNEPVSAPVIQSVSPKPGGIPAPPAPTPIVQHSVPTVFTTPQVLTQQTVVQGQNLTAAAKAFAKANVIVPYSNLPGTGPGTGGTTDTNLSPTVVKEMGVPAGYQSVRIGLTPEGANQYAVIPENMTYTQYLQAQAAKPVVAVVPSLSVAQQQDAANQKAAALMKQKLSQRLGP